MTKGLHVKNPSRTKQELLEENSSLWQRIRELEQSEAERKRLAADLQEGRQRFQALVETLYDWVWEVDRQGHYTYISPRLKTVLGYEPEDVVGKTPFDLMPAEEAQRLAGIFGPMVLQQKPIIALENINLHKDGHPVVLETNGLPFYDAHGNFAGYRGADRDITERKHAEEALKESEQRYRELSILDDLTRLYNSRYFYSQLGMEIARADRYGQPLTLLLLDLDDFKTFNDAYGHVEGDRVLMRLGQVVKRCLRRTDSAYRYGGEEFTVIMPMTTSEEGAVTAERIRTEFKKETFSPAPDLDVHVTASVGVARYRPPEEMKAFVQRVDQLMYRGKKNGKDRVCHDPRFQAQFSP